MGKLEEYRKKIDAIDTEMARLFEERMKVSHDVGEYKKERSLPVKDNAREGAIIEAAGSRISDEEIRPYYVDFQKNVIKNSCAYQEKLMSGMKVGYSGVEGAYAYIAARRMFPGSVLVSYAGFEQAYKAAEDGEVDCAVLPFENNYAGEVGAVMDLAFSGSLFINRVLNLDIEQNLIGLKGADISRIKTVISHPKALQQCDAYIKKRGFETQEFSNTARAAKYVREQNDPTVAALASEETAELLGLDILERKVHTDRNNSSRFGVFSRSLNLLPKDIGNEKCSFILMFTIPNEAGSLAMTLDIIGAHGFNMRNLKSRPRKELLWNYYFYIEAEGNISSENGVDMMAELGAVCGDLKLVGTYYNEDDHTG